MKHLTYGTASVTLLIVAGLMLVATAAQAQQRVVLTSPKPRYHQTLSQHEFILEGGLAEPYGDQKDDFTTTDIGFGSTTGYEVGFRIRQYIGEKFAISPSFHYTRFGTASGFTDGNNSGSLAYEIRTSNYRYGLDFQALTGDSYSPMRLYVLGGISLVNNRYRDALEGNSTYNASVNAPAYSAGLGLKFNNIEVAAEYVVNRFSTNKFTFDSLQHDFNWDSLVIRAALSFGR
ncbi:MAG: hypothetical protein ACI9UQ_002368 [Candidatus Krumholzibacteriia bacterium]